MYIYLNRLLTNCGSRYKLRSYLNFRVHHYDNGEYEKALEYYNKAKELDDKTYLLDEYIEKAKRKLSL